MVYPDALLLRTVRFGPVKDSSGKPARGTGFVVSETAVYWGDTGELILNDPKPVTFDSQGVLSFRWPCSDQSGLTDGRGNRVYDFSTTLSVNLRDPLAPSLPDVTFLTPTSTDPLQLHQDLSVFRTAGYVSGVVTVEVFPDLTEVAPGIWTIGTTP